MNISKRKIQVGDVVRLIGCTDQWKITRINYSGFIYGKQIFSYGESEETYFGCLNDLTGFPESWGLNWELVESSISNIVQPNQVAITDLSDWRAWAHNQPGECKCGIKKEDCFYHKD